MFERLGGMTFDKIGRAYRVPVTDYQRPGGGLLVSSGCGIMMSVMDMAHSLRWCVDLDAVKDARLADWLICAERLAEFIVVIGWFSISDPVPLRNAVAGLANPGAVLVYTQGAKIGCGIECESLAELIQRLGIRTGKNDSAPLTGNDLTTRTLSRHQENSFGLKSEHAATASDGNIGRESHSRTIQTATPRGRSLNSGE